MAAHFKPTNQADQNCHSWMLRSHLVSTFFCPANKPSPYFRFLLFTLIVNHAIFVFTMTKKAGIPGTKVPQGRYSAFLPTPLPPMLDWTPRLVRLLSDADRLIGKLAGEGGRLPNPHVLMRPFVRREAVLSSKIEGTLATLGELLAAEAGIAVERSPDDLREVGNYVVALDHGVSQLGKLPICVRLIRQLHEKLMTGVRGHHATRG